jgi:hypothetical protein
MKIKYLLAVLALFVILSCNKNNNGELSLKINSVSSNVVPIGGSLRVIFDFTEKANVIDTIGMIKLRINQDSPPPFGTIRDTIFYAVPTYPKSGKGQLQLDLDHDIDLVSAISPPTIGNPPQNESDSLVIRFFAKDAANNVSDTVNTGTIVIFR